MGVIGLHGGSRRMREISLFVTFLFFFLSFFRFLISPTGRHGWLIFTIYMSNDAFLCKEVPFGGLDDEFSHLPPFLRQNLKICITTSISVCPSVDIHSYIAKSQSTGRWWKHTSVIVKQLLRPRHCSSLDLRHASQYIIVSLSVSLSLSLCLSLSLSVCLSVSLSVCLWRWWIRIT